MTVTRNRRVMGNKLGLTINGRDYWADIAKYELTPESDDKDTLTFADAAAGSSSSWKLKGEAILSFDTNSFWDTVWANAGKTVPFTLAPLGNRAATTTAPHFKGSVKIGSKPPVSSEAGNTKGATFSFEWTCEGEPQMVTTGSEMGTGSQEDAG